MTYEKIVEKVKKVYAKADASMLTGHMAVEFDVWGEGEGAFYVEATDGKLDVQPYEYYDKNAAVRVSSDDLNDIFAGKLTIEDAYNDGKLTVEGDLGAVLALAKVKIKKTATRKKAAEKTETEKKTTAKKATTKKAATKKAATKETKAEEPAATKTAVKKTAAKKADVKKPAAKKNSK